MIKTLTTQVLKGVLAVSIVVCGAADANATGKYSKKEADVVATQTELTKPGKRTSGSEPTLSAKAFLLRKGDPIKAATDGQIVLLEKLSAMTSENDPEKPDLLFRLGQLFEEQVRYYNFLARELDEEIFRASVPLTSI